jgi:hypothetical protein
VPITFASSFADGLFPNCMEHVISLEVLNSVRQSNFCPACDSISEKLTKGNHEKLALETLPPPPLTEVTLKKIKHTCWVILKDPNDSVEISGDDC